METKIHWDKIYTEKNANEVSWTQEYPTLSMQFIEEIDLDKNASIIDVGGGEGFFAETLLNAGFTNITVMDISEVAIQKAKNRMGKEAGKINWMVDDVTSFKSENTFDFWHDRAVFHFLKNEKDIELYQENLTQMLNANGYFLLGTFSPTGPLKCSGLEIVQYNADEMEALFKKDFILIKQYEHVHVTPFNTQQNFQFGGFKKIK